MNTRWFGRTLNALLLACAACTAAQAQSQDFPSKPIRIVVPFAPGGSTDIVARLVAQAMQEKWGQPGVVDNRPGAGGNVGADLVYHSAPDGYTLLVSPLPPLAINEFLYSKMSFDPSKFAPVSLLVTNANILVVNPSVPAHNVKELIDYARKYPDRINYGSQGNGTTSHLAAEMFKSMAGLDITHVPYKGSGPAQADLMAGQVQMMFAEMGASINLVRAGKLRALAVTSAKRYPALPDLPTVGETLPGFVSTTSSSLVAPPGTPPEIVNKISALMADMMKDPAVIAKLDELSAVPVGSTPDGLTKYLAGERKRLGEVIRKVGVHVD